MAPVVFHQDRVGAHAAAVATLRNISSAQAQFQATAKADADNDGTGEFGAFIELEPGVAAEMARQVLESHDVYERTRQIGFATVEATYGFQACRDRVAALLDQFGRM